MGLLSWFSKWFNNDWENISVQEVPKWVKRSLSKSLPSPVSRPSNFVMYFKGKTFKYKVVYSETNSRIDMDYYRKLRRS